MLTKKHIYRIGLRSALVVISITILLFASLVITGFYYHSVNNSPPMRYSTSNTISPFQENIETSGSTKSNSDSSIGNVMTSQIDSFEIVSYKEIERPEIIDEPSNFHSEFDIDPIENNLFYEVNFETHFTEWSVGESIWEIGSPIHGPTDLCGNSSTCMGTNLYGDYPDFLNSRITSPSIYLPLIDENQEIVLTLSNWFDVHQGDEVKVAISIEIEENYWMEHPPIIVQSGHSDKWQQIEKTITKFAGNKIKLVFLLEQNDENSGIGSGWYIDDIRINRITRQPMFH